MHRGGFPFPETLWSLVREAAGGGVASLEARRELCLLYYEPVRAFARLVIFDPLEAEEVSHEFQEKKILSGRLAAEAREEVGPFRALVMTAFRNFARDVNRCRERRERLDPRAVVEGEWSRRASDRRAEEELLKALRKQTLIRSTEFVGLLCVAEDQGVHFALFKAHELSEREVAPTWEDLGRPFGLSAVQAHGRAEVAERKLGLFLRAAESGHVDRARRDATEVASIVCALFFQRGWPTDDAVQVLCGRSLPFDRIAIVQRLAKKLVKKAADEDRSRAAAVLEQAAAAASFHQRDQVPGGPSVSQRRSEWKRLATEFQRQALGRVFSRALHKAAQEDPRSSPLTSGIGRMIAW